MIPILALPYDGPFLVAEPPPGSTDGNIYIDLRMVSAIEMRTDAGHARLHFNGGWQAIVIDDDSDLLATWKQARG